MNKLLRSTLIATIGICTVLSLSAKGGTGMQLDNFKTFSERLEVIDGVTGEPYTGDDPVVDAFRRSVDVLLVTIHKRLLAAESRKLNTRNKALVPQANEIEKLLKAFGVKRFIPKGSFLTKPRAVVQRLINDPFIRIEQIVVWDLAKLGNDPSNLPHNPHAKNIRFNTETGKWERRVLTHWKAAWASGRSTKFVTKQQGLNLETQKGFHLGNDRLGNDVKPSAFEEVGIAYPIILDPDIAPQEQVEQLSRNFVLNIIHLYDPFDWKTRDAAHYSVDFLNQIKEYLRKSKVKTADKDWFDNVIGRFISDVAILRTVDAASLYEIEIQNRARGYRAALGEGTDFLNWHSSEDRSVSYKLDGTISPPSISFSSAGNARWILVDAYRRYGQAFVDALSEGFSNASKDTDPQEVVKQALAHVSGTSADNYIKQASKAQRKVFTDMIDGKG